MEDWALIRRLDADGVPEARIARQLGISRTTVIKVVKSQAPPRYERTPGPTSFTVFEPDRGAGHAPRRCARAGRLDGLDPLVQ